MAIETRTGDDGRPRYYVRYDTRDPVTGARKRHRIPGSFTNKKEAEKAERAAMHQRDTGTLLEPDKTTLGELLDVWLPVVAQGLRPNTMVDYRGTVTKHLKPSAIARIEVRKLTAPALQAQYNAWLSAGLSPSVLAKIHQRLSQVLDYAVRMRIAHRNVAKDVKPPRIERPQFDHWSVEEARAFLAEARHDALWPLWPLLLAEGMRRGEALGLRWLDVDLERGVAHIRQTVILDKANKGAAKIAGTKTRAGTRSVKLADSTVAALKAHKKVWAARALAAEEWAGHDLIICSNRGTPINPGNVKRNQARICQAAGVRPIRTHDLRHTSATILLAAGEPLKTIADRLGHTSIRVTADMYAHSTAEMQDRAAAMMDRLLG
jgi:integrase